MIIWYYDWGVDAFPTLIDVRGLTSDRKRNDRKRKSFKYLNAAKPISTREVSVRMGTRGRGGARSL